MATPVYAAILGLIFVFLSFRVIKQRSKANVLLGSGQDPLLIKAIRVHGNFSEYTPFALLLLFFLETNMVNTQINGAIFIHILGIILIIGRLLHCYGVSKVQEIFKLRVIGMIMTFLMIIITSIGIFISYL